LMISPATTYSPNRSVIVRPCHSTRRMVVAIAAD